MYVIFKFKGSDGKVRELYQDDVIGRQTLIKRDSRSLGLKEDALYLVLEGSEEAIERARKIAGDFEVRGDEAEQVYRKIKEEEDSASMGMGAIFG